ncbi:MAG: class IV adenylate cyclase [Sedimentisphaerales bacterium]|nr:class IV adenylate cyclase [Sedimentisphaerales bacterium]
MHTEIEAKIAIEDPDLLIQRIDQYGGQRKREVIQRDMFFDRPDHSLRTADCGLRLRQEKYQDCVKTLLCFKGPRQPDRPYKQRQEIEFEASDALLARQFLYALGFESTLAYEKRRCEWQLKDCIVCLDKVVELGHFLEIEGPSDQAIRQVQSLLDLADKPNIKQSYAALLADLLETQSRQDRELFF